MITIDQIEELKKRTNISYNEAKTLLEKHNGDIVEAIIELEQAKKTKSANSKTLSLWNKIVEIFKKGNSTKILITKNGETVADLPVNFYLFATLFSLHLLLASLIIIFILGCKISIKKSEGKTLDFDEVIIDVSDKFKNAASKFSKNANPECTKTQDEKQPTKDSLNLQKDNYNEFTVE